MKIEDNETRIVGQWIFDGSKMIADESCLRIDWLLNKHLKLIATHESGWLILYQDPNDKRYWQLDFEHSGMHGGGPPSLILLSEAEAKNKFNVPSGSLSGDPEE